MTSHAPVSLSDQSPEADTTMPRRPIRRLSVETESSRPVTDTTLISQLPTSTTLPRRRGKTSTRQHGERGTATGLPLSTRNRAKSSPTMSYYALARVQRQLTDSPPARVHRGTVTAGCPRVFQTRGSSVEEDRSTRRLAVVCSDCSVRTHSPRSAAERPVISRSAQLGPTAHQHRQRRLAGRSRACPTISRLEQPP